MKKKFTMLQLDPRVEKLIELTLHEFKARRPHQDKITKIQFINTLLEYACQEFLNDPQHKREAELLNDNEKVIAAAGVPRAGL